MDVVCEAASNLLTRVPETASGARRRGQILDLLPLGARDREDKHLGYSHPTLNSELLRAVIDEKDLYFSPVIGVYGAG